MLVDAARAP